MSHAIPVQMDPNGMFSSVSIFLLANKGLLLNETEQPSNSALQDHQGEPGRTSWTKLSSIWTIAFAFEIMVTLGCGSQTT